MSTPKLVPTPKNCDVTVRQAIQKLASKLGAGGEPTYAGLTLSGLTASRLIASDSNKVLESSDLASWIDGTTNQITVTDDSDGTVTLSAPQDIHVDAHPEFAGATIKDSNDNVVLYIDADDFYITEYTATVPVDGNPIGLLLTLTYAGL